MKKILKLIPGILLCLLISIPSWILGKHFPIIGGPVFAILIGMIITLFYTEKIKTAPGITYTSKKILQYAVVLLGFGLNLSEIIKVGTTSLPIIIGTISTSLIVSFIIYKLINIPKNVSILVGVGSSICGGSAIAATAPVINASDEDIAQAISVIFLFNVIAALIFPSLGNALGLSNDGFGLFAGTAVNDTSSVTATATAWDGMHAGANALEFATIVKLTRTLAIIPITLILAVITSKQAKGENNNFSIRSIFPYFILFFVAASIITTVSVSLGVSNDFFKPFKELSKFFIVMAMSAIGLNTNIIKLFKNGGKPIFQGLCCWICIAIVSLVMQKLIGIW